METKQALRERKNALAQEVQKLLDDNPGNKWKPEHQTKYDELLGGIDECAAEMKRIDDINARMTEEMVQDSADKAAHDAKGKDDPSRAVFAKWLRGGDRAVTAAEWADIRATMSTTTTTQGGYAVPTVVADAVVDALKAYGGVRQVATVINTAGSGPLNFPTSDGTAETGEVIAENTTATAADPSFGVATVTAWKFSSKIVAIPFELLQDSAMDMEAFIRGRIVHRLGRIENTKFTIGSGSAEPYGVVPQATLGKTGTTGQTITVIFDDLVDMIHAVDPAYRVGTCRWMMNDASLGKIRKLKDTASRPVFIPGWDGLGKAMPDTILGYGVVSNPDVVVMAANAKSILFGDFSKYIVRDVMGLTLFRFDDSAYAKLGQVGFLAWQRSGGNLIDTAAVKYYINSAT
jgi:HK97 family phage major capsid protein